MTEKYPDERGWLIERHLQSVTHYWTGHSIDKGCWASSPGKKVKG